MTKVEDYQLTDSAKGKIDHWLTKYPADQKQSAVIAALHIVQDEIRWVPKSAMQAVADYLQMPEIAVYEVGTFYTMFNLKPVGKHKISICTNISCLLCDSTKIVNHLKDKLNVDFGETTKDGKYTLEEVECLAACKNAPAMMIDKMYHENLTTEKVDKILKELG